MITLDELKIPKGLRLVADDIVGITDSVCLSVLDEEYADLARRAVAKLARKRPSPLQTSRRATWAAGVVYALGHVNFLSNPASEPCMTADQLSAAFGVAKSTMTSKARQVRDLLRISHFSPEFQRADVAAQNPLAWIIDVNGLAVDARHVPPGIQAEAYRRGLIPYIPALGPDETVARARSQVTERRPAADAPAPSETLDLLEHCSELKRHLVEFARSWRFSRQFDQALRAGSRGEAVDESGLINIIDHFILQRPLPGGRTVVETSRMNGFLTWYTRRMLEEADPAAGSPDADVAARTPAFSVSDDLAGAPTVALAYDETEGLMFLANFALVREAFENPGLAADSEHRQPVLEYLKDDSISALPFRRLAGADTARASQLFRHLLDKPGFSWERDGEALLRKHKPWCFGAKPLPPVTPLSSELAEALPSSR